MEPVLSPCGRYYGVRLESQVDVYETATNKHVYCFRQSVSTLVALVAGSIPVELQPLTHHTFSDTQRMVTLVTSRLSHVTWHAAARITQRWSSYGGCTFSHRPTQHYNFAVFDETHVSNNARYAVSKNGQRVDFDTATVTTFHYTKRVHIAHVSDSGIVAYITLNFHLYVDNVYIDTLLFYHSFRINPFNGAPCVYATRMRNGHFFEINLLEPTFTTLVDTLPDTSHTFSASTLLVSRGRLKRTMTLPRDGYVPRIIALILASKRLPRLPPEIWHLVFMDIV